MGEARQHTYISPVVYFVVKLFCDIEVYKYNNE